MWVLGSNWATFCQSNPATLPVVIIHMCSTKKVTLTDYTFRVKQKLLVGVPGSVSVCVWYVCIMSCFTVADIWLVVYFPCLGHKWFKCESCKCLVYIKCELDCVFVECPGVDGWITHSHTRHMLKLNSHIYTQSAVVSTTWNLKSYEENVNNKNKIQLAIKQNYVCVAFFTLKLALELYWILLIVNKTLFYLFSLLSPTLLLTLMRCSWLTKTNFPVLWVRLCSCPCVCCSYGGSLC